MSRLAVDRQFDDRICMKLLKSRLEEPTSPWRRATRNDILGNTAALRTSSEITDQIRDKYHEKLTEGNVLIGSSTKNPVRSQEQYSTQKRVFRTRPNSTAVGKLTCSTPAVRVTSENDHKSGATSKFNSWDEILLLPQARSGPGASSCRR